MPPAAEAVVWQDASRKGGKNQDVETQGPRLAKRSATREAFLQEFDTD